MRSIFPHNLFYNLEPSLSHEEMDHFLTETYNWCKVINLKPQMVGQFLKDLESFMSTSPEGKAGQEVQIDIKL